jgi:hypothetical protein
MLNSYYETKGYYNSDSALTSGVEKVFTVVVYTNPDLYR